MHNWFARCTVFSHKSLRGTQSGSRRGFWFVWSVMVLTPLGPWSPRNLFLTRTWGMPGAQAVSCERGCVQTRSLGVKKRLGGWRHNQDARREELYRSTGYTSLASSVCSGVAFWHPGLWNVTLTSIFHTTSWSQCSIDKCFKVPGYFSDMKVTLLYK